MKRRMLSLLICAALMLTLLPCTALAGSANTSVYVGIEDLVNGDGSVSYRLNDGKGGITDENAAEAHYNLKYDPATDTLTLNNAYILGAKNAEGNSYAIHIKTDGNVNIVLCGMNTVTGGDAPAVGYNNKSSCGINIESGSVTVGGGSLNCFGATYGVKSGGNVALTAGKLTAVGINTGIYAAAVDCTAGSVLAVGYAYAADLGARVENADINGSAKYGCAAASLAVITHTFNNERVRYSVPSDIPGSDGDPVRTLTLSAASPMQPSGDAGYPPAINDPTRDVEVTPAADGSTAIKIYSPNADSFQWQRKLPGGSWENLPGETKASLALSGKDADGTQYRCWAYNQYGNALSRVFTVRAANTQTPPQTGDAHTAAGYVMIALLVTVLGAAIYRRKREA